MPLQSEETGQQPNRLIHESSPYLLQHAYNPVDWYPWCEEALQRAREEDKLIFLSIGYSSCHWCHVMEQESFEDPQIARIMNENYINIKVDREERPDLDAIYIEAVQMMTGQGGWPLNVWLTPEQVPVFGGTYFPRQSLYGRPGFAQVLEKVVSVYRNEPENVRNQTHQMKQALSRDLLESVSEGSLDESLMHQAFESHKTGFDPAYGGFSTAPKFPMAMSLEFLLRYYHITGEQKAREMALHSLDSMLRGGIYDHLGGGFHRYSTDDRWLVPHFEKMLYDNALLLSTLCDAWQLTSDEAYHRTIHETLAWLERDMLHEEGGFFSALDADSEGEEGRFYVWSHREIHELLAPEDARIFCTVYGVTSEGNWEGTNILNREKEPEAHADELGMSADELRAAIRRSKNTLLEARAQRIRPGFDDKVITSWNAMMLKSLCKAWRATGEETFRRLARGNADFLLNRVWDGDTLYRIYKNGSASQHGFLDDYGLLAEALVWLFEITGELSYLQTADRLAAALTDRFLDESGKGFYYLSDRHEQLVVRKRDLMDNAEPSGNSAACAALQRVGRLTGNPDHASIVEQVIARLAGVCGTYGSAFAYLQQVIAMQLHPGREIMVIGPDPEPFRERWARMYDPHSLFIWGENFQDAPYPTLKDKKMLEGQTTAYVCEHFACRRPATDLWNFEQLVTGGSRGSASSGGASPGGTSPGSASQNDGT